MMSVRSFAKIICIFLVMSCLSGCHDAEEKKAGDNVAVRTGGVLPAQSEALLDQEWKLYREKHPEMDETEARQQFKAIQILSEKARASKPQEAETEAAWALRRALAARWMKVKVEDYFSPESVKDDFIQEAIDAYAFESGHPALVTASHVLIQPDDHSTDEERRKVISEVHARLAALPVVTNDDLSREAVNLTRMGYKADMNADLEFPRYPMQAFLGEQLPYRPVVEPFAAAAFALDAAHPLSDVVPSEFGYHIILFKSRTEEKKPKIADVRDYMMSRILAQGRSIGSDQFIQNLQNQADIRINEDKLRESIARQ